jgi:RecA-family ATPase
MEELDQLRQPWPRVWDEAPLAEPDDYERELLWAAEPDHEPLEVIRADTLDGIAVPARHWIVDGMIPGRTVTLLSGDGGAGKSLIALDLAVAIVTGGEWLGNIPEPGPVVFLTAEDEMDEVHRRLDGIVRERAVSYSDLSQLAIVPRAGRDALLAAPDQTKALRATRLLEQLECVIRDYRAKLIVLDTAADLHAGNENDRAQVRQFISLLRGIALTHEVGVVLLSHPSQFGIQNGSGYSGSTAWNNSVRSRLYLERPKADEGCEPDPDLRVLRLMKANYGKAGSEIQLRWREGRFIVEQGPSGLHGLAADEKAKNVMLRLIGKLEDQDIAVSANPGPTYAPVILARRGDAEGVKKAAFKSAMEALLDEGNLEVRNVGPPSRRRTRLVGTGRAASAVEPT